MFWKQAFRVQTSPADALLCHCILQEMAVKENSVFYCWWPNVLLRAWDVIKLYIEETEKLSGEK